MNRNAGRQAVARRFTAWATPRAVMRKQTFQRRSTRGALPTRLNDETARRGGYSLIELVIGLAASVMLLGGMASAVAVSTRSLSLADTGSGARAISTDVQRDFLADLQRATGFTERTASAVTFTVPDRTGDGRPEKLRYAWAGAGSPLTLQMNGGTVQNLATNVQQFQLSYRTKSITAPVVPDEALPTSGRLLFVSGGTYTPPTFLQALNNQPGTVGMMATENPKVSLFQSWGFSVTTISASQPAADFTAAYAKNDVIFVSSEPGTSSAESRLKSVTLGIVNENPALTESQGFCMGSGTTTGTALKIGATNHYITQGYTALQQVSILNSSTTLQSFPSPKASSMSILGLNTSDNKVNFATIAAGRLSVASVAVPARRVQLPWATPSFDINSLTADGQNLVKVSLMWAAGNGSDGNPSLVTVGPTTTSGLKGYFYFMSAEMVASPITLVEKGEMLELSAYVKSNGLPIRLAIYSDLGGKPQTRLAQTGLLAGTGSTTWITGPIPAVVLNPGTYWLAVSLSNNDQYVYFAAPNNVTTSNITQTTFTSGFPSLWVPGSKGRTATYPNTQLLAYGSYIAVP